MGPLIVVELMICGVCLTIGLLHLSIFIFRSERKADLFFAIMSFGAAGAAFFETSMYRAITPENFIAAFKAQITFHGIIWVSLTWFIAAYTGAARRWLATAVAIGYALAIFVNLASPFGIIFTGIDALQTLTLPWGETITVAYGPVNPWRFLPDVTWVALMYLALEGCIRLGRRGQRRRAWFFGICLLTFLGVAYLHGTLGDLGILGPPSLFTFTFLGLILVMSASITRDVVRASELSCQVEANERHWRALLENVQLLVVGLDRTGRVTYINPFFTQLTGFTKTEILEQDWFGHVLPESERKRLRGVFQQALEEGVPPHYQNKILTKFGDERVIHWSNVGLFDPPGRLTGTLSVGQDITERQQAVQELETLKGRLEAENIYLREELENHSGFKEIVGNSNALFYVLEKVRQVAETDAIVLIQGETGVGKELIARAIHQTGNRASRPFIQVNCAALPANLIESELFGHEAGAFTGATQRRRGRFELADGGTLFLDEVSELPLELQPKLLRVLQEGQFERVGGSRTQAVSVRIIAATNRDLKEEVRAGRFRADLYYRLNVFPITVPPLRRRREDIPLLVRYFIPKISLQVGKTVDQIPPHVMEQLVAGDWPGNVRELKNVLERAVISSAGTVLSPPEGFLSKSDDKPSAPDPATDEPTGLDELQRRHIIRILSRTKGRIEGAGGAAELLEINASTLRARIRKLGIIRQQYL